jgi:NADH-quinone oxidoreductase subunit E
MAREDVLEIIQKHKNEKGVIAILEDIQENYGYLPENALKTVANQTGCSLVDIYGVATFYKAFSLKQRGKHLLSVCLGTACHVRGGADIAKAFERLLQIKAGETTADKEFTLETVACLGACALGPIVVADGHYFSKVSVVTVEKILEKVKNGLDEGELKENHRIFPVEVNCIRCNHSLMDPEHTIEGYPSIRVTVSSEGNHGWMRLSGLYGSYTSESDFPIPKESVAHFFCPHCHTELKAATECTECGALMIPMLLRNGSGILRICSRYGCRWHMLDLEGINL